MPLFFALVTCYRFIKLMSLTVFLVFVRLVVYRFLVPLCFTCDIKSLGFTDPIRNRSRPQDLEIFVVKELVSITLSTAQPFLILCNPAQKVSKLVGVAFKVAQHFYQLKFRRCIFHKVRIIKLFLKLVDKLILGILSFIDFFIVFYIIV
jgi:hypothetical protein